MSQQLYDAFCENVKARMTKLGITRTQLAEQLGVTSSFVSQILNGHRRPGLDSLDAFAKALKTQPSELIRFFQKTA